MSDVEPKFISLPDQENTEHTTTSFLLDQHFTACSIPASNANAVAHRIVAEAAPSSTSTVYTLDRSGFREAFDTQARLTSVGVKHPRSSELRFTIATSQGENKSPRLVAVFNGDLAVQVAAFENRNDDRCNFIQLGQEHNDENYIMTTADHSRLDYVRAIKALLTNEHTPEQLKLLATFALNELDKIAQEPVDIERIAGISRKFKEQLPYGSSRQARILLADGDDTPLQTMIETTFPDWQFPVSLADGREARLVLLQQCARRSKLGAIMLGNKPRNVGEGDMILAAKTAEDIAVPLYTISDVDDTIHDTDGWPISPQDIPVLQRLSVQARNVEISHLLRELNTARKEYNPLHIEAHLARLQDAIEEASDLDYLVIEACAPENRPAMVEMLEMFNEYYGGDESFSINKKAYQIISTAAIQLDPAHNYSRYVTGPRSADALSLCQEFLEKPQGGVDLWTRFQDIMRSSGVPVSEIGHGLDELLRVAIRTKEFESATQDPAHAHVAFVQQTQVQEKIQSALGKYQPKLEDLTQKLDDIATSEEQRVFGAYKKFKTPTGSIDLDVSAEVSYQNGTYKLRLYLVPYGLQGKQSPLVRFDGEISRVRPNDIDGSEIDEILDLLKVTKA